MKRALLFLALALGAPVAAAETNVCRAIEALPVVISSPGVYCLGENLAITATTGDERAIFIDSTTDVVLDCNGFRLTGTRVTPANLATHEQFTGIYIGSSSRVAVRNCRTAGFGYGVQVNRSDDGLPRSRDVQIEDNIIEGAWVGILASPEGDSVIRDNQLHSILAYGFWIDVPPGKLDVRGNIVMRVGDTTNWTGQGAHLRTDGGGGGWLAMEDNYFTEVRSPAAAAAGAVIDMDGTPGAIGVVLAGNIVAAPANPAHKGGVTEAVANQYASSCTDNLLLGYGALPENCSDPSNIAH